MRAPIPLSAKIRPILKIASNCWWELSQPQNWIHGKTSASCAKAQKDREGLHCNITPLQLYSKIDFRDFRGAIFVEKLGFLFLFGVCMNHGADAGMKILRH